MKNDLNFEVTNSHLQKEENGRWEKYSDILLLKSSPTISEY